MGTMINGQVVTRQTVRPLKVDEVHSASEERKRQVFDRVIERRWGTSINPPKTDPGIDYEEYEDDDEEARFIPDIEDTVDATGRLLNQNPVYDTLINAEVMLQQGEEYTTGKVMGRAVGPDDRVSGTFDSNPYLNTIIYEVEFPDGQVKEYGANIIAENMLTQVDADGHSLTMMEGIVGHRKHPDKAIEKADGFVYTKSGQKRQRKTTQGWDLLIRWKDGSESWQKLKDMKESHPIDAAEYAKARGIADEPAFAWWIPYTLRKRDVILSAVKSRIRKTTHKYGIETPLR